MRFAFIATLILVTTSAGCTSHDTPAAATAEVTSKPKDSAVEPPEKVIHLVACREPENIDKPICNTTPCLAKAVKHGDEWQLVVNRDPPQPSYAHGEFDAYLEVSFVGKHGEVDLGTAMIPAGSTTGTLTGRDWSRSPPTEVTCRRFDKGPPMHQSGSAAG